jgi:hypothetical protein
MVWRWDGSKFRGMTTAETPIQESEGGFFITSYNVQASRLFSVFPPGESPQIFIIVGSSLGPNDSLFYRVRQDVLTGKFLVVSARARQGG